MTRRLLNLLTALSLQLCAAVCVLWVRSLRHEDRVSHPIGGARYTVVSSSGCVTVYSPPPAAGPAPPDARRAIAAMRNDQTCWVVWFDAGPTNYIFEMGFPLHDTPLYEAWRALRRAGPATPLLEALEDPDRFAAAHMLLWYSHRPSPKPGLIECRPVPGGSLGPNPNPGAFEGEQVHGGTPWLAADYDGLTVTMTAWVPPGAAPGVGKDLDEHCLLGRVDPDELPRVREQWHRRLDISAGSVAWKHVALMTALLPALRAATALRRRAGRRNALRRGLCPSCGYDLRATADRCPECGHTPAGATL